MAKVKLLLHFIVVIFLACSCGENKKPISDSDLPKYILSPAKISDDNSQITWRITVLDSVVSKRQLVALATKLKEEDTQDRTITTIHFYPNGANTDMSSQVSVFYNKNEELKDSDLNDSPCEIQIRTEDYQVSGTPAMKINE